jgi:hypothetical protein
MVRVILCVLLLSGCAKLLKKKYKDCSAFDFHNYEVERVHKCKMLEE